jgi:DNA-binding protein YbaB
MDTMNIGSADESLQQLQDIASAFEGEVDRTDRQSFTATDQDRTVEVVVNARGWLTGLYIENGLLRLGAETVRQRIVEALDNAKAAVAAAAGSGDAEFEAKIGAMVAQLEQLEDIRTNSR